MKTTHAHPFVRLFGRYLREQGFPMTQQRSSIADVVFGSDEHLSVEEIEGCLRGRGERIGKATIYRTLDLLVRSKLVDEHDFGEGFKRYEHRLSRQPVHAHLICLSCAKVTEFRSSEILRLEERVAHDHGFQPSRHKLEIYGLCADCRRAGVRLEDEGLTCPIESI